MKNNLLVLLTDLLCHVCELHTQSLLVFSMEMGNRSIHREDIFASLFALTKGKLRFRICIHNHTEG